MKRNERTRLMRLYYSQLLRLDIKPSFANKVVFMLGNSDPSTTSFTQLTTALNHTLKSMLPSRVKHAPPLFKANEELLHATIQSRNIAFNLVHSNPSASTRLKYVIARINAQQAVRNAKSTWIKDKCDSINTGFNFGSCGKDAWDFVKT